MLTEENKKFEEISSSLSDNILLNAGYTEVEVMNMEEDEKMRILINLDNQEVEG